MAVAALRFVEGRGSGEDNSFGSRSAPRWLVILVVALTTSVAAAYETYLVGHSGAEAVWSGLG